ncbi:MAG: hypothetical protein M1140_02300 [Chloroflexi bacterium]|nr:hypothetical protein [Chloroflexota bacterium]
MKRFVYILLLMLCVAVGILVITIVGSMNPSQQTTLNAYLRYYAPSEPGLRVLQSVRALRPTLFTPEMSGLVFGVTSHYYVDVPPSSGWIAGRPLPYPPEQMYCTVLESSRGQSVVFVALHGDDYNADWLVHQSRAPWPSGELNAQLASVGCQFKP